MTNQSIKISDNCWKHTDKSGNVFYTKTFDPDSGYHREDGPAVECANGYKAWYIDGKLYREDGPAIEDAGGYKAWYIDGQLHRIDGPAIENSNKTKVWYINNKLHRTDGPACEYSDGTKCWYYHGRRIDVSSQEEFELYFKNLIFI